MRSDISLMRFFNPKSMPIILQSEVAECGLACIAMVLNYHGHKIDLTSLRQKHPASMHGGTLQDMVRLADQLKLAGRPLKLDLGALMQLQTPCILHWNMDHFVVLKKATKKGITIHDPAIGKRFYTYEEASKLFTGVALELTPTPDFESKEERVQLKLNQFWHHVVGLKRSLINILFLSLILQAFSIAVPFYSQLVIDDVLLTHDEHLLTILAIGFLMLAGLQVVTSMIRSMAVLHLGNMMSFQMTVNVFSHLIKLPGDFFSKRHIGDIVSRFSSLTQVKEILTTGIISAIVDGVMAIATLIMMFVYSPMLTLVVLAAVVIYFVLRLAFFNPMRNLTEEAITTKADESTNFMETVRAVEGIKIFGRETDRLSLWQNKFANVINAGIRTSKLDIKFQGANDLLFGIENVVVLYIGAMLIMSNEFSVGMLFAFIAFKSNFMEKAFSLIEKVIEFKMLDLHLTRIADIVLQDQEDTGLLNPDYQPTGQLEIKNLAFRYSETEYPVFYKLNLIVQPGESVAIVGPSGCGKSTLMHLMLGLYQPLRGDILVDGRTLSDIGLTNFRQHIAAVTQDDELLSGSISDNICFFDHKHDISLVAECAKQAAIYDDIMAMPMQFNSLIGDMGSALSGGQKQRILLARALYKQPKILFLDEATSHLDSDTEHLVNDAIKLLDTTRIIIAHRKETIESADRVLQLEHNQLVDITAKIKGTG